MSYTQMITNDLGEPLGTETLYDDEPGYYSEWDDDYGPEDYDEDDGTDPDFGMVEFIDDEDYPGTQQVAPDWIDLCTVPDLG
jgi:hypothetical protein